MATRVWHLLLHGLTLRLGKATTGKQTWPQNLCESETLCEERSLGGQAYLQECVVFMLGFARKRNPLAEQCTPHEKKTQT